MECAKQNEEWSWSAAVSLVINGEHIAEKRKGFELFEQVVLGNIVDYPPNVNWFGQFALADHKNCIKLMQQKGWKPNIADIRLVTQTEKKKEFFESMYLTPCFVSALDGFWVFPKDNRAFFYPTSRLFVQENGGYINHINCVDYCIWRSFVIDNKWVIVDIQRLNIDGDTNDIFMFVIEEQGGVGDGGKLKNVFYKL